MANSNTTITIGLIGEGAGEFMWLLEKAALEKFSKVHGGPTWQLLGQGRLRFANAGVAFGFGSRKGLFETGPTGYVVGVV